MFIGYFDYLVIGILIYFNFKYWGRNFNKNIGCLSFTLGVFFLGIFLPFISMMIEYQINGPWIDSFEAIYTLFRFPIYWIILTIQIIVIAIKFELKKK